MAETRSPWPAAICAATAATFVALAGAFLLGVMMLVHPGLFAHPDVVPLPAGGHAADNLEAALYTASALCFLVGVVFLTLAYRKLP